MTLKEDLLANLRNLQDLVARLEKEIRAEQWDTVLESIRGIAVFQGDLKATVVLSDEFRKRKRHA